MLSIPSSLDDNMVVEEGNNYRADANVLIVVTNYSKFENKTTPAWLFLSCYMGCNIVVIMFNYV